jgi:hypothetical protein
MIEFAPRRLVIPLKGDHVLGPKRHGIGSVVTFTSDVRAQRRSAQGVAVSRRLR